MHALTAALKERSINRLRITAVIHGLAGLPDLFLPFADNKTLFGTVLRESPFDSDLLIWYLAAPAFLAVVVAALLVRRFLGQKVYSVEIVLAYLLSSACLNCWSYI